MKDKIKLQLSDIAGYLPYGLKVLQKYRPTNRVYTVTMLGDYFHKGYSKKFGNLIKVGFKERSMVCWDLFYNGEVQIYKPILRPMSDLNKPMTHPDINDGEEFVPIDELNSYIDEDVISHKGINTMFHYKGVSCGYNLNVYTGIIQLLSQWHFDYNGLIDKGLAIDLNTLKE